MLGCTLATPGNVTAGENTSEKLRPLLMTDRFLPLKYYIPIFLPIKFLCGFHNHCTIIHWFRWRYYDSHVYDENVATKCASSKDVVYVRVIREIVTPWINLARQLLNNDKNDLYGWLALIDQTELISNIVSYSIRLVCSLRVRWTAMKRVL